MAVCRIGQPTGAQYEGLFSAGISVVMSTRDLRSIGYRAAAVIPSVRHGWLTAAVGRLGLESDSPLITAFGLGSIPNEGTIHICFFGVLRRQIQTTAALLPTAISAGHS